MKSKELIVWGTKKLSEKFLYLIYLTCISIRYILQKPQRNSHIYLGRSCRSLSPDILLIITDKINEEYKIPIELYITGTSLKEISSKTGLSFLSITYKIYCGKKEIEDQLKLL